MERAIQEQKQQMELRDTQSVQHGQKLEKMEQQAENATQHVRKMEVSLAECHKEIEMYVEQLKEVRSAHEQELEERRLEVRFAQGLTWEGDLAPVIQRADNSIQRVKCIVWKLEYIATFPLDRLIRSLNNWGQISSL